LIQFVPETLQTPVTVAGGRFQALLFLEDGARGQICACAADLALPAQMTLFCLQLIFEMRLQRKQTCIIGQKFPALPGELQRLIKLPLLLAGLDLSGKRGNELFSGLGGLAGGLLRQRFQGRWELSLT